MAQADRQRASEAYTGREMFAADLEFPTSAEIIPLRLPA